VYILALANVIPNLNGEAKQNARAVLVKRLARMTPADFQDKLYDPSPEVRRAVALACALKDDTTHVTRLIQLLIDREQAVGTAAREALKALSGGEDFGPPPQLPACPAPLEDRDEVVTVPTPDASSIMREGASGQSSHFHHRQRTVSESSGVVPGLPLRQS
jgi:hypothetical protein